MMTDFVQALRSKYVEQGEDLADQIYIPNDMRTITTQIKLVGFAKVVSIQKQLRYLASIDLSDQKIAEAGPIKSLGDSLTGVRVINLAGNHINWIELINVLECLPRLQELIITSNHLDSRPNLTQINNSNNGEGIFNPLSSLIIGQVHIKWQDLVDILCSIWKQVNDLDLWNSQLTCDDMLLINGHDRLLLFIQQISALRLSNNNFNSPSFMNQIGPMDSLVELDLSNCKMASFRVDAKLAKTLQHLSILNISYNDLIDWSDISSLMKLLKLKSLICHENPFYLSAKVCKPLIVGRLGGINKLNREEITRTFRRDSEIYYMRSVLEDYRNFQKGNDNDFARQHPRFNELAEIYGLPEDTSDKPVQDKYITLDLYYDGQRLTKKVPRNMRVSNLAMLVKRMFKMSPSTAIRMTCCSHSDDGKQQLDYELEQGAQTLSFYFVRDDKKVVISKID